MAKAYPKSKFTGFDYHDGSIESARASAKRQNLQDAVKFRCRPRPRFPAPATTW